MVDSTQRPVSQKDAIDLEATNGQQQDRSMCITPHDVISDSKEIDVDSGEVGKVKARPTTNTYEQEVPPHKYNHNHNKSDVELAIARAVPCDGNKGVGLLYSSKKMNIKQVAIPAFEYDPNDNHNKSFCRRYAMIVGACGILGIALIVLLALLVFLPKAESGDAASIYQTDTPSVTKTHIASPTDSIRDTVVIDYLAQELSPKIFVKGTSYSMAADWILHHDLQQLDADTDRDLKLLMQRYALAVFYFSSTQNGSTPWRSCNPLSLSSLEGPLSVAGANNTATDNDATENSNTCTFLETTRSPDGFLIVHNEVRGNIRWLSSLHECEWQGVVCTETNEVRGIDVVGQGIQGNLGRLLAGGAGPEVDEDNSVSNMLLRAFPFLQVIGLSNNDLTGTLPPSFAGFADLIQLELHGNSLSGEIPISFFDKLTSLQLLNLGQNRLSGRLDTKIGQLTELRGLHLHQNNFRGQFPTEIGKLSSFLNHSSIVGNEFSGPLPTEIGRLTRLIDFQYSSNLFTGTIPTEYGELTSIDIFRLDDNQLSGTIPVELCNLTSSRAIILERNALTGPLPTTELSQLQLLVRFQVNNNQLTGPIPSQLGELSSLRLAWLHLNQFTGEMPNKVCEAASIPNTGVNFLQADCSPIDNPPTPCRCCSACCDRSTGICSAVR